MARSASARGTAAPVTTKIRSAGGATSSPASTTRTRSARNGVAACTKVPSHWRSAAAPRRASQTSWTTWVEPSAKLSHIP